ncbi:hypothetical protein HDU76_012468 [Blyttiomyces sp. JEL0837]|nr:hypothetical protein HDU76_012468 [Blyttiomyces sp. JEL0837]
MRTALILAFLVSISTVFAATVTNDNPANPQELDASTAGIKKLPPKVIKKPYPVKVPVEKKVPVKVPVEKKVPVPKPYPVKVPVEKKVPVPKPYPVKQPVKVSVKVPVKVPAPPKKQGGGYKNHEVDTNIFIEGGFGGFGGRGIGGFEGLGAERNGLSGLGGLGEELFDVSAAAVAHPFSNNNEASVPGKAYHGAYGGRYPGYASGGYGYGAYGAYGGYGKKAPPKKQGGYKNHEDSTNIFIENGFKGFGGRGIGAFEGLGADAGALDGGLGGI